MAFLLKLPCVACWRRNAAKTLFRKPAEVSKANVAGVEESLGMLVTSGLSRLEETTEYQFIEEYVDIEQPAGGQGTASGAKGATG